MRSRKPLGIPNLLYVAFSSHSKINPRPIVVNGEDDALIVSDLHLFKPFNQEKVGRFLSENGIRTLMILGDLFDDLRRPLESVELGLYLRLAADRLGLPTGVDVHYVLSKHSHDPILLCDKQTFNIDGITIHVYRRPILLVRDEESFYCTHGDEYIKKGFLAYLVNVFAHHAEEDLFVEKISKKKTVADGTWFIMGHTHMPGIDHAAKVANTGGWGSPVREKIGYGMMLIDRRVCLVSFYV